MRSRAHVVQQFVHARRRLDRRRWFGSAAFSRTTASAEEAGVLDEHRSPFNNPFKRRVGTSTTSARARALRVSCWHHHHNSDPPTLHQDHHRQRVPFSSSTTTSDDSSIPSPSSSVSSAEVAHFDTLADTWWDAERNPLIGMNPIRVSYIVNTLRSAGLIPATASGVSSNGDDSSSSSMHTASAVQQPLRGLRALDVGCGGGLLSESLARLGATVTAVDPSVEVANAAGQHSKHHPLTRGIDYRGGMSVEDLAREICDNGSSSIADRDGDDGKENDTSTAHLFDVVCVLEVVEHATDPKSLLDNACRLLRPGGILFVSTLNRTAKSYVLAIAGAEHIMRMVPVGTHRWDKFLSPAEVGGMVTGVSNFEVVDVCGMVLVPPFVNMQWTLDRNDVSVNWIGAYRRTE